MYLLAVPPLIASPLFALMNNLQAGTLLMMNRKCSGRHRRKHISSSSSIAAAFFSTDNCRHAICSIGGGELGCTNPGVTSSQPRFQSYSADGPFVRRTRQRYESGGSKQQRCKHLPRSGPAQFPVGGSEQASARLSLRSERDASCHRRFSLAAPSTGCGGPAKPATFSGYLL